MYKIFLCLRYLRRRVAAWLAMIAVALCVWMLVIVVSVMDGFVSKIEVAAKGLYGDVVVEGNSLDGLPYYDEFIAEIKRQLPEMIEDASPFIMTFGIMEAPFVNASNRQTVQIVGIRLPERVRVSAFGEGLTYQAGMAEPTFDPPFETVIASLKKQIDQTNQAARKAVAEHLAPDQRAKLATMNAHAILMAFGAKLPDNQRYQLISLSNATYYQNEMLKILRHAGPYQQRLAELARQIQQAIDDGTATQPAGEPDEDSFTVPTKEDVLREQLERLALEAGMTYDTGTRFPFQPPSHRAIIGLGMPGFMFRTGDGTIIRKAGPGTDIVLTLIPMGEKHRSDMAFRPVREMFTVIDESRTDVSTVDSNTVSIPFETLQQLNRMGASFDVDGRLVRPARTSQIHVKIKPAFIKERERANSRLAVRLGMDKRLPDALTEVAEEIDRVGRAFQNDPRYAEAFFTGDTGIYAFSWREKQRPLVGQIESQRTLVVIMFSIISMVAVVLIFVIFYVIVLQKTKDIGVIKSLGGSRLGVAAIFLGYGAATGLVGAILGSFLGWLFVRNINPIHDWVGRTFDYRVWNREWFMFDEIPNQVDASTLVTISIGAIAAGLVGALAPAIIASLMQPVRALRYE